MHAEELPSRRDRRFDVITIGDICVDLIMSGADVVPRFGQVEKLVDDYSLELGGSCCIFACQAARLGLRTAILGRIGDDQFGHFMLERLAEAGVDTSNVIVTPALKTGIGVSLCQGHDRAILTFPGSVAAVEPADVTDEFLGSARHLHHGSFFLHARLRPAMPAIFRRARALGLTTSLDTNWDPAEEWNSTLAETLALTDVSLPNEEEALRASHTHDVDEALAWLLARAGIVALKQGARGAALYQGEHIWRWVTPAPPGGDSIGAGDSFDAGFLAGWLRGLPLATCLRIACLCGASVAGGVGGLAGQLSWEAIQERLGPRAQFEASV